MLVIENIEEVMIDALKEIQRPAKNLKDLEVGMTYKNWKGLGGIDLPGAELGGGFVWVKNGAAEYIIPDLNE